MFSQGQISIDVQRAIKKNGTSPIIKCKICRILIDESIKMMIEKMPGVSVELKNKPIYHVYQVLTLANGAVLRFDKDEQVRTVPAISQNIEAIEFTTLPIPLEEWFEKGEIWAGKKKYWIYDPLAANCQWFVLWTLQGNNKLTPDRANFILQGDLIQYFGHVSQITMKLVTNLAALLRGAFVY